MIPFDTMSHMATRAFVIEELLETIYDAAKEADELAGRGKMGNLTYRIRHLTHGASGLAGALDNDLSELMSACPQDEAPPPPPATISLGKGLRELSLTPLAGNILHSEGVSTVGALIALTEMDLLKMPNLGCKTLRDIKEKLAVFGLALKERGAV